MPPHVVIIMADQLRPDVIGPQYTPNIDALAREGVSFKHAYCASPLCVPARGAFFTGRYPNSTGCLINPWEKLDRVHGSVRAGTENLYLLMEDQWDSRHAGKQHLLTADHFDKSETSKTHWKTEDDYAEFLKANKKRAPGGSRYRSIMPEMAQGRITRKKEYSIPATGCYEEEFDYFFDGYIARQALAALKDRDRNKPLLLNAMFLAPHPPFEIPQPWFSMYADANLPQNVGVWSKRQSPLQLYNLPGVLGARYTRADWQRIWPVYLGLVTLLDHCVGMLIAELKAQGIYDETLIVFTSDHGEMLGSHCLWQKMCMYEESVRTPLIFKFPNARPSKVEVSDVVSAIDVLPTLCDYLGLAKPSGLPGVSLLPALHGQRIPRERVYIQFDGNGGRGNFQRCVIDGDFKLIVDLFKDELFLELYDLKNDPQEMNSLSFDSTHRERIEELLRALRRHMKETDDLLTIPADAYAKFIADYIAFEQ